MKWVESPMGDGQVMHQMMQNAAGVITLSIPPINASRYHNAQISSYHNHRDFSHHPPLRLSLKARAEGEIHGTAGFGFWNHPFAPGERSFRLPKAVWFFLGSPPNNMALAFDQPGHGWKCATIDATRWQFLGLLPTAPVGFLLMRSPALYRKLWPLGQRALGVSEHHLGEHIPQENHTYTLDWLPDHVQFAIDGQTVHRADIALKGPLGFVAWVDNQYAVVTPQGRFQFGLVDVPQRQTLIIEALTIIAL